MIFWFGLIGFACFFVGGITTAIVPSGNPSQLSGVSRMFSIAGAWGGGIFLLCGVLLVFQLVLFLTRNWSSLSSFGRFVGSVGTAFFFIFAGYIYHYFFVIRKATAR
jgi:hypothetical protein